MYRVDVAINGEYGTYGRTFVRDITKNDGNYIVDEINKFIQSDNQKLNIQQGFNYSKIVEGLISYFILAIIFRAFAVLATRLESSYTTFIFDKNSGRLIRDRKTIFGQEPLYYCSLDQIEAIEIEEIHHSEQDWFELLLILKNRNRVNLRIGSYSLSYLKKKQRVIGNFLNIKQNIKLL